MNQKMQLEENMIFDSWERWISSLVGKAAEENPLLQEFAAYNEVSIQSPLTMMFCSFSAGMRSGFNTCEDLHSQKTPKIKICIGEDYQNVIKDSYEMQEITIFADCYATAIRGVHQLIRRGICDPDILLRMNELIEKEK